MAARKLEQDKKNFLENKFALDNNTMAIFLNLRDLYISASCKIFQIDYSVIRGPCSILLTISLLCRCKSCLVLLHKLNAYQKCTRNIISGQWLKALFNIFSQFSKQFWKFSFLTSLIQINSNWARCLSCSLFAIAINSLATL